MHLVSKTAAHEPVPAKELRAANGQATQQALPMQWHGDDALNPNPDASLDGTSAAAYPKLYTLPRMDHWWRAGRHASMLTR